MAVQVLPPPTAATGAARYHISAKGNPARCRATIKRGCPLAVQEHFATPEEARQWLQEQAADAHATVPQSLRRKPPLPAKRPPAPLTAKALAAALEKRRAAPAPLAPLEPQLAPQDLRCILRELQEEGVLQEVDNLHLSKGGLRGLCRAGGGRETFIYCDLTAPQGAFVFLGDDPEGPEEGEGPLVPRHGSHKLPRGKTYSSAHLKESLKCLLQEVAAKEGAWEQDEEAVGAAYLGFNHHRLSEGLRHGTLSPQLQETLRRMATADELPQETMVYRGYRSLDDAFVETVNRGEYKENGLLSTSTDPAVALGFSGCREGSVVLRLLLPAGTRCLDLSRQAEAEVLLPPGQDLTQAQALRLTAEEAAALRGLKA